MYHGIFIYHALKDNLGCFYDLSVMNKADTNIHVQVLCGHKFSFKIYGVNGKSMFSFVRNY